ncbi:C40 family peptidase [Streptomyces syringium]|uniref:C40 family peptidase n=1 Tax=Streptomyces syringium TaxID=76729 RepID=UPI0033CA8C07
MVSRMHSRWQGAVIAVLLALISGFFGPSLEQADAAPRSPENESVAHLQAQLEAKYHQVEQAAERYHEAEEQARHSRARVRDLGVRLAGQERMFSEARNEVGRLARQQYRSSSLLPQMYLAPGREAFQDTFRYQHLLERLSTQRTTALTKLRATTRAVRTLGLNAQRSLLRAQRWAALQRAVKLTAGRELKSLHALIASLTATQSRQLRKLEGQQTDAAQKRFLQAHQQVTGPGARSSSGDQAVAFAFQQVGKPYVWGAEGPSSYDCSGLTSRAWAHAGVRIPRTSQEQWTRLPRIALEALRPGDLVIYYREATHVAIYIGSGQVIHAPRPGAYVKQSPIAFGLVRGAVRPASRDQPLRQPQPGPAASTP